MSRRRARRGLDEFARIARYYAPLAGPGAFGLRDDVALIDGPRGTQYVLKTDAIVEGVHFFRSDPPRDIARKVLRVNLSDLAAKGAWPVGYLLTTALTDAQDEAWLKKFSAGLAADQKEFGIALLGGDSVRTAGAVTLSVAAIGRIARGKAMLRRGARPGDLIYVSGTLGDAALGLKILNGEINGLPDRHRRYLVSRYRVPRPRLELGRALVGIGHAAMDISDGLVADLGHLCEVSGVAAVVEAGRVPLSGAASAAIKVVPRLIRSVLTGGDDYEILFAAPPTARRRLAAMPVTEIGRFAAGSGVRVFDAHGRPISVGAGGYRHF